MSASYARVRPQSENALRFEALLVRYPDLNDQELDELTDLFPRLGLVDRGLLTADNSLSGRLDAFHRDHGHRMKVPTAELVSLLAFPLLAALLALWWTLG
jgi:hypothetical protein